MESKIDNNYNSTTTIISVSDLPSGTVIAGCILEGNESFYRGNSKCWDGANLRRQVPRCPTGTFEYPTYRTSGVDAGGGYVTGDGGYIRTELNGFLCIKE